MTHTNNNDRARALSRRRLLKNVTGYTLALGAPIPFGENLASGLVPVALAQSSNTSHGKPGLTTLSERPLNMETPPHLLNDDVTPASRLFVRNNGAAPTFLEEDIANWRLKIDGEVDNELDIALSDLKMNFETVTLQLQLECGGNGRKFFNPGVSGNQWSFGAVGCPEWTGVRLRDLLEAAGVKENAYYTAHYGADPHLSGNPDKMPISRGMPISKALEPHTLVAWAINGAPLPLLNGYPLRLVTPGWPGSLSHKWLYKITLRDRMHDGPKMMGYSYRMPAYPVAPGTDVPEEDMEVIEAMPVKSLVTFPETGQKRNAGQAFPIYGSAWAGEADIDYVDVSIDFGATWTKAEMAPLANKYAWRRWKASIALPEIGYYEIWARATDTNGVAQPANTPGWNPRGYLNNMQHRIAVFAI